MDDIAALRKRITDLGGYQEQGPHYNRGVRDALADAETFLVRGEIAVAEHWVLIAECRAGAIPVEEFERLDPIGGAWVGISDGSPAWVGDGTSLPCQRDRVRAALIAQGFPWPQGTIEVRRSAGPESDLPIAIEILVCMGVVSPSAPRPRGALRPDGQIYDSAVPLPPTLSEFVKPYATAAVT